MTSSQPSSLQCRQKLHKRQHSTPVAFEAMKVQIPPNTTQRQQMHRRGQSYDLGRSPIRRHQHIGSNVSMNTNLGPITGQQILREAQQQRTARPGQQYIQPQVDPSVAQQCGGYSSHQSLSNSPYDLQMDALMSASQDMGAHSQFQSIQLPLSQGFEESYMLDENSQHYFHLQSLQNATQVTPIDRRMSQPDLRIQTGLRPYTPGHQIQTAHFPLTPAQTPMQHQSVSLQNSPRWQQNDNIVSPRPVSMQKSRSLQGIAEHQEVDQFAQSFEAPAFPAGQSRSTIMEPVKQQRPAHIKTKSVSSLRNESTPLFGEVNEQTKRLEEAPQPTLHSSEAPSSPTRPALSPRRMSISDLHLDPGISASIEETNVTLDDIAQFIEGPDPEDNKWVCKYEGCDKKFGRKENIKSHVQTHLGDRQFRCDHCQKCFVRGHDLKRHAKIHTGQKAYACLCGNAFARHDALTRHRQRGMCIGAFEGIVRKEIKRGRPRKHRPEMDDRVDKASRTRHKKQTGTGSQVDVYASSASSCSISSWGSPPTETLDHLSIQGGDPHSPAMTYDDTLHLFGLNDQSIDFSSQRHDESIGQVALPPNMFSFTPPASPGYSTGHKPSPYHREISPADLTSFIEQSHMGQGPRQPTKQLRHLEPELNSFTSTDEFNGASLPASTIDSFELPISSLAQQSTNSTQQALSLPSLSHSSSPPPQESAAALVFDFADEPNNLRMSTMSNMSFGLSAVTKAMNVDDSDTQPSRNEFDSFLDFNDDSQLSLGMQMGVDGNDSFFNSLQ